jgi:hypothetical protein
MSYQPQKQTCQNCKNDFVIESDDFSFYEKIKVPLIRLRNHFYNFDKFVFAVDKTFN